MPTAAPQTPVAFVVNGSPASPMGHRARAFAARLGDPFRVRLLYRSARKVHSIGALVNELARWRPRACYVFDMAFSGVFAGTAAKALTGCRLLLDFGDAITALASELGRGPVRRTLTRGLEAIALRTADRLVVRGSYHREWLARRGVGSEFIPDGVETDLFRPTDATELRRQLGLTDVLTIGLVGSLVWNPRRRTCYGWDLVEVIRLLKGAPVAGLVIGDGSGLPELREQCRRYGIGGQMRFLGRLPYEQLPLYLGLMDVCLSTQTNDLAGRVRTTGKLPLYMACGRFVLASRVGEAARALPPEMLVEYQNTLDLGYPGRLAERIRPILDDRSILLRGAANRATARRLFDYDVLAEQVRRVILDAVGAAPSVRRAIAPGTIRLGVAADFPDEGWPSMDLCAEMLLTHLGPATAGRLAVERVGPPFRRRFGRASGRRAAFNADRLLNRFWDYPRYVRSRARDFDLFHVVDHSYAQLVQALPAGRVGVFCHDLDTFRCLLDPSSHPRPRWFRLMARHVLRGFQKAAVVFHPTAAVRRQIESYGLIDPARLVYAPHAAAPEFHPEPGPDDPAVLPELGGRPFLLHVGSCLPRKRLDVLLDVFAAARARHPDLRLVQVGGAWTAALAGQIDRLGLATAVHQVRGLGRPALAALYRRAALVLQTSVAEGFGLPVLEALACGAAVVASDIPPLCEVGGAAATYCPVGDPPAWADTVLGLLDHPQDAPDRAARLAQAGRFSWSAQARTIAGAYLRLL